jgi:hypothetical protein
MPVDNATSEFRKRVSAPRLTLTYTAAHFRLEELGITVGELMRMLRSSRVLRSEKVGDGTNFVIEAKRRSEEPISIVVEGDNSSDELRILSIFVRPLKF